MPSQVLLAPGLIAGGVVAAGYPEKEPIKQEWGEWTGRFGVDWSPELAFTDKTMLYAFYSRGYKGGGANPPQPDFATMQDLEDMIDRGIWTREDYELAIEMNVFPILELTGVEYGPTFEPEFVNAFELGTKNTLLDGAMTLNLTAFYYDYTDYQVSQIRDRTAVNENFDAEAWGIEVETMFAPSRDLQIIANVGYLDTAIANGESSIDIMNRTQGNPDFVLTKPWIQLPSNCVVPVAVAESWANSNDNNDVYWKMCGGYLGILEALTPSAPIDPATGERYTPLRYDGSNGTVDINGGAGIRADLGGNELPNAPHWTANIGAQYGMDILDGWRATVRGDVYWQSQSYHRVYNYEPYDKLHGWYNANLSLWIENEKGLKIELYAKNIFDKTPITDAFLNSDDAALTTNVFTLDPRLIGLSFRQEF